MYNEENANLKEVTKTNNNSFPAILDRLDVLIDEFNHNRKRVESIRGALHPVKENLDAGPLQKEHQSGILNEINYRIEVLANISRDINNNQCVISEQLGIN